MIKTTEIISTTPDCEIVSSRIFNSSKELLFRAWTEPEHLKNWWGPNGFTNTFHEFDLRVGGRWKFTMHGPEAGHYQNEVVFIKIDKPNLIAWNRISQPYFQVVTMFEELTDGKTRLVFRMIFNSSEECAKVKKFAVDKNEENFDRLEDELRKMKSE
jgi:uncharacterized protein YndB with AHSA1/START domain